MLARTDALIHGWEEALARALEFKRIGVDAVFVEALPDRQSMERCVRELDMPVFANSESETFPSYKRTLSGHVSPRTLRLECASHRGRQDGESVRPGPGRAGFLRGRIPMDPGGCQAEEHPRGPRGP